MGALRAPGPDGMHAVFYERFWDLLDDDLVKEVLEVVLEGWNDTTIVLIPKTNNPTLASQFWPISLCNVVYKVISNMLANRLTVIFPHVINVHQSAFVPGRLMLSMTTIIFEPCGLGSANPNGRMACVVGTQKNCPWRNHSKSDTELLWLSLHWRLTIKDQQRRMPNKKMEETPGR